MAGMLLLLLLLCVLGFVASRLRRRRVGWACYGLALVLFAISACGPVPMWLAMHLQAPYAARPTVTWSQRNAIVVLGAGNTLIFATGEVLPPVNAGNRLIESYALYRECKQAGNDCKLIVSGGDGSDVGKSEAAAYGDTLLRMGMNRDDLMLESRSLSTWQNAEYVQPMLQAYAPQRVVLVTSAMHMRRAQKAFEHFGIDVLPVRSDYLGLWYSWLPTSQSMALTDRCLHEYAGVLVYDLYNAMGWTPPSRRHAAR
jgi:uncharacterized SAM-binding protein YcdF (DUF218 family)